MILEDVDCDTCGGAASDEVLRAPDARLGGAEVFRVVRCRGCGHVYVDPRPRVEDLSAHYPPADAYPPHAGGPRRGFAARVPRVIASLPSAAARRTACLLHNTLAYRPVLAPDRPGARMLDVGCGAGEGLATFRALGWEVEGLEPSPVAAARARVGFTIREGSLEEVPLPEEAFDLVTMVHSLEHLPSPRRGLEKIRRCLRSGGRLLVSVPNFASVDRALLGPGWQGLDLPRHLHHFEPPTLRRALEGAGLEVELLSATAHPGVVVAHLEARRAGARLPSPVRWAVGALLLPLAVARRTTSLWAIARRA